MTGNGAETLAERVEAVIAELDGVAVVQTGDERELRGAGRLFAVVWRRRASRWCSIRRSPRPRAARRT